MFVKLSLVILTLLTHLDAEGLGLFERLDALTSRDVDVDLDPRAAVQLDLLPDYDGAEALAASVRERLASEGRALEVFVEIIPGDAELPPSYRVAVGPFVDFEDAERAKLELEGLGYDGFVRELDETLGC